MVHERCDSGFSNETSMNPAGAAGTIDAARCGHEQGRFRIESGNALFYSPAVRRESREPILTLR
jgi:hypothetical protein